MMGRQSADQGQFFYAFNLEDHVPQDHLLRAIEQFLDLSELHAYLAPLYSHTGRPSIDPELMIRMLIIGYCYGIRSERRLCEEVSLNLAYRWFCRLSIEDTVPDHSTFSKNRHGRFRDGDVLRFVFEGVVRRGMADGLVGGEGFAIDASLIKADASRWRRVGDEEPFEQRDPAEASRPVREYLSALDEEAESKRPRRLSPTDPASRWAARWGVRPFYAYSANYLVDTDAGIIVDVEATPANRIDEVDATRTLVERVEQRLAMTPQRLVGDTAYGTGPLLSWMVEDKGIEPHVPVWDKSQRVDGTFSRSDFVYDDEADEYRCPAGNPLRGSGVPTQTDIHIYMARGRDCRGCSLKPRCCPNAPLRKVTRSIHEAARDVARAIASTPHYQHSRNERKKVEMLFAHLKRILNLDRLRLRGLSGANDEFLLAATVQNLRRMAKLRAQPPPRGIPAPA